MSLPFPLPLSPLPSPFFLPPPSLPCLPSSPPYSDIFSVFDNLETEESFCALIAKTKTKRKRENMKISCLHSSHFTTEKPFQPFFPWWKSTIKGFVVILFFFLNCCLKKCARILLVSYESLTFSRPIASVRQK